MKWDSKTSITVGFALTLCSSALIAVLAYQSTRHLIRASDWVTHTDEVLQELEATLEAVTHAETAQRGFVLTGNDLYLQSHQSAIQESYEHVRRLQRLTSDNPLQKSRVVQLQDAISQKMQWQEKVLEVMKTHGEEAAGKTVATGKGQALMEAVRGLIAEMTTEEQRLLRQRTDLARANANSALRTLTAFALATVVFLSLAYFLIMRDLRARQQVQSRLEIAQEQLHSALQAEKELARLDPLTMVANRRSFFETTEAECGRADRFGHPLTMAYIDVDNLKQVNDAHGHDVGDAVLREVADTLRTSIRAVDAVARLGGDEFALLLPNTGAMAAEGVLSKLQHALLETMRRQNWPVTFSIGAAVFVPPLDSCNRMLNITDAIMYSVKTQGKNAIRIELSGSSTGRSWNAR